MTEYHKEAQDVARRRTLYQIRYFHDKTVFSPLRRGILPEPAIEGVVSRVPHYKKFETRPATVLSSIT